MNYQGPPPALKPLIQIVWEWMHRQGIVHSMLVGAIASVLIIAGIECNKWRATWIEQPGPQPAPDTRVWKPHRCSKCGTELLQRCLPNEEPTPIHGCPNCPMTEEEFEELKRKLREESK